jgi:hypothetical protein
LAAAGRETLLLRLAGPAGAHRLASLFVVALLPGSQCQMRDWNIHSKYFTFTLLSSSWQSHYSVWLTSGFDTERVVSSTNTRNAGRFSEILSINNANISRILVARQLQQLLNPFVGWRAFLIAHLI